MLQYTKNRNKPVNLAERGGGGWVYSTISCFILFDMKPINSFIVNSSSNACQIRFCQISLFYTIYQTTSTEKKPKKKTPLSPFLKFFFWNIEYGRYLTVQDRRVYSPHLI